MQAHELTPMFTAEDTPLLRSVALGILGGMVAFGVLTTLIIGFAWSDQSWGAAVAIGAFGGFWAGLFFGSAAGIAAYQMGVERSHALIDDPGAASMPIEPIGSGPIIRTS
jgi:hypothetical protein